MKNALLIQALLGKRLGLISRSGSCGTTAAARDAEKQIDDLYRDKYDLKQLEDTQVRAQSTKDGCLEIADRSAVKREAQEMERSKQLEKDRGRER